MGMETRADSDGDVNKEISKSPKVSSSKKEVKNLYDVLFIAASTLIAILFTAILIFIEKYTGFDLSSKLWGIGGIIPAITVFAIGMIIFSFLSSGQRLRETDTYGRILVELDKREYRFRSMIENGSDMITLIGIDGTILYESRSVKRILGYEPEELVEQNIFKYIHKKDLLRAGRTLTRSLLNSNKLLNIEIRFRHKDGSYRLLEGSGKNLFGDPSVRGIVINSRDITERKRAEEELKKYQDNLEMLVEERTDEIIKANKKLRKEITERKRAEEAISDAKQRLDHLVQASPAVIYSCGPHPEYPTTFISENVEITLGYKTEEFYDTPHFWSERVHPDDTKLAAREFSRLINGKSVSCEYRFRHKDGRYIWLHDEVVPTFNADGKINGYIGSWFDITERKQMDAEKQARAEFLARLVGIKDLTELTQLFYEYLSALMPCDAGALFMKSKDNSNENLEVVFSFDTDENGKRKIDKSREIMTPDPDTALWRVLESGEREIIHRTEEQMADIETNIRYLSAFNKRPSRALAFIPISIHGQLVGTFTVQSYKPDVYTDHRVSILETIAADLALALTATKATEALRESEERFRTLVENQGEGIAIVDTNENITFANPAAYDILGADSSGLIGRNLSEFTVPDQFDKVLKQTASQFDGTKNSYEIEITRPDGEKRCLLITSTPLFENDGTLKNVLGVFRDITEKRRMEEELAKNEKLESIGLLAGGIAHDFNNFLTAILGNISMVIQEADKSDEIPSKLESAEDAALQAQMLTRQLLTFSKGGIPALETDCIEDITRETIRFALSGSNVRCEYFFPSDLRMAKFDRGQIGQVIQNLIINADQAMPDGGVIKLTAENVRIRQNQMPPLESGNYVKISIKDNGPGIAEENQSKIFDPFFTTKQHGSGLGLATAHSIVRKHNGNLEVKSRPGEGAEFIIYLPSTTERPKPKLSGNIFLGYGSGRILVVDDEKFIRDMLERMLTKSGYVVSCAPEGSIAVEMYKNSLISESPFDLVVVDLTIPGGMGGKEIIVKLREIDPEVKAIVSSGYSNDPIMAEYEKYGFVGRIAKPYKTNELYQVIQNAFDDPRLEEKNINAALTP